MNTTSQTDQFAGALPPLPRRAFFPRPLGTVTNLLARYRWSVEHHGPCLGNLALDAIAEPVAALKDGLQQNAAEADGLEQAALKIASEIKHALADGVIDPAERRMLAKSGPRLQALAEVHHRHATELTR